MFFKAVHQFGGNNNVLGYTYSIHFFFIMGQIAERGTITA